VSPGDRQPLPGYEFDGRGPAQRRLLEWLGERVPDCEFDVAVAQRSPAGPWALKLHAPNRVPTCAELLQAEPWIERVAVRPQHLYVRIGCERLCEWVAEGFGSSLSASAPGRHAGSRAACSTPAAGEEGVGRTVLVRAVDAEARERAELPRSLSLFRETAVARSAVALLRARGFDVDLELLPPSRETYEELWADAPGSVTHTLVVGQAVPMPTECERGDHVVHLAVGEVDVRHGPLRARHGGSVSADDAIAEVARMLRGREPETSEAYGAAVLALLLIATPRARRVQFDDAALAREATTLASLIDGIGDRGSVATQDDDARAASVEDIRELAAELDLLPTNASRATAALEPALIARSLRAIAESRQLVAGADCSSAGTAPLVDAMARAVATAFELAGLGAGLSTASPAV
jgi:hypothetical protein